MRSLLACTLAVLAVGVIATGGNGNGHGHEHGHGHGHQCVCKYDNYGAGLAGFGAGGGKHRHILDTRLNHQEIRIGRIGGMLKEVRDVFKSEAGKRDQIIHDHRDISKRIRKLEGYSCSSEQFFCGKDERRCISKLLVCDGSNDCDNGQDESEVTCHNPVASGNTFKGQINAVDLCTQRKPKALSFVITSVRKRNFFSSRLNIKANVIVHLPDAEGGEVDQTDTLQVDGYYMFADRRLWFYPPEDDRLAFDCVFDHPEDDHCHGAIIHEQTLSKCLEFTMFLE